MAVIEPEVLSGGADEHKLYKYINGRDGDVIWLSDDSPLLTIALDWGYKKQEPL